MKFASICFSAAAIIFIAATPGWAQYLENFEGFFNGTTIDSLANWSGTGAEIQTSANIGGRSGVLNPQEEFLRFARLDLAGQSVQPQATDDFWEVQADIHVFAGEANQGFSLHGNPGGDRWMEIGWLPGEWTFRIWNAEGGDPQFNTRAADPQGDTDGIRTMRFRMDPSTGTAAGFIESGGTTLTLDSTGGGSFPTTNYENVNRLDFFLDRRSTIGSAGQSAEFGGTIDSVGILVPEPSTGLLAGAGLLCLAFCRRRRRRSIH